MSKFDKPAYLDYSQGQMISTQDTGEARTQSVPVEIKEFFSALPHKALFVTLFVVWIALFHFFGNSTLGYVNTPSIFGWWMWMRSRGVEEEHVWIVPLVALIIFWFKRGELLGVAKKTWWPAFFFLIFAIIIHLLGFRVQQTRISVLGFLIGLYGLMGLSWGPQWLKKTAFPFALLFFCMPLGNSAEYVTFPLRMLATKLSVACSHAIGIDVIQDGSRIFDPKRTFEYDVAPACSGIRSLVTLVAASVIYGFLNFKSGWRRLLVVAAAVPLAVISNMLRLLAIILAAQAAGQPAGDFVHKSDWLSLLLYVPAFGGLFLVGWFLRERSLQRVPSAELNPAT